MTKGWLKGLSTEQKAMAIVDAKLHWWRQGKGRHVELEHYIDRYDGHLSEVLSEARELLRSGLDRVQKGWTQGLFHEPDYAGDDKYCMVGALQTGVLYQDFSQRSRGEIDDWFQWSNRMHRAWVYNLALDFLLELVREEGFQEVEPYNDFIGRSQEDVVLLYKRALLRADEAVSQQQLVDQGVTDDQMVLL